MKRGFRAVLLALAVMALPAAAGAEPIAYRLTVDGLACPFCAYGVEKQLSTLEGVSGIKTDIRSGHVTLEMADGTTLDEKAARQAVEAAGFSLRGFEKVPGKP